jgi:fluoride ion exporter CrcB/FEX
VTVVDRHHEPSWLGLGLGLVTGFLGAYTTYSTFAQETYHLGTAHLAAAILNVALGVVVGLAAGGQEAWWSGTCKATTHGGARARSNARQHAVQRPRYA